jgi:predicted Zn-dependent protease
MSHGSKWAHGFRNAYALFGLARVQVRRGEYREAIRLYEAILARNPEDSRTVLLVGQAIGAWHGPEASRAYLEAHLARHPGTHEIEGALSRVRAVP